ncbi:MAG: hypothetical protein EP319_03100 [Deltaproteobacteria bacterium]|nr:MAG: hypothetical protein EP319_03100 [Deltaproteobacteria bacterium]
MMALKDEREDRKKGLLAHDFIDPRKELPHHPSSIHANYYQPIRTDSFLKILAIIPDPNSFRFVDIGAGTGKALILAADFGFKEISGVEFVPKLCEIARQNIERFSSKYPDIKFEIIEEDFRNITYSDKPTVFLLNDPFDNEMMMEFVSIFKKFERNHSWLIYKNVNLRSMPALRSLDTSHFYKTYDFDGNLFEVWSPRSSR